MQVFESAMDGLVGPFVGVRLVKVGQHLSCEPARCPPQWDQLGQYIWNGATDSRDDLPHHCFAQAGA